MTRDVATATPEASVKDVVWSLLYNKVSALPVVDPRHRPVGMVSETDLLRRRPGLPNSKGDSREAITAGDLMTTPVWTVCPECSLATATQMISEHGVGRLPVIDASGTLVGVVSRSDLLRPLLRRDEAIQNEVALEVLNRKLQVASGNVSATVQDGVVTLRGSVQKKSNIGVIVTLCRHVEGVIEVKSRLGYKEDDIVKNSNPEQNEKK
ncbi:CBS domain-containing protein [[Kitasatospora] papulosa]|uniref:CBS domain-containing protein n=1 Tax=[Kitasatospora] papulosa TaxID=1464011 RepID=UPI00363E3E10